MPTCKLVTKSYARLLYNDYVSNPSKFADLIDETTRKHIDGLTYDESLTDKILEKTFVGLAKDETKKSSTSFASPTNTGNMYTASAWVSLASLLYYVGSDNLKNKRISIFSYGSGLASTLLSVTVKGDVSAITKVLDFDYKLGDGRKIQSPEDYLAAIELREKAHLQRALNHKVLLTT